MISIIIIYQLTRRQPINITKNNREKKKIDGLNLYPNVCNLSIHILSMKMKEQIFLIQILRFEYELVD